MKVNRREMFTIKTEKKNTIKSFRRRGGSRRFSNMVYVALVKSGDKILRYIIIIQPDI